MFEGLDLDYSLLHCPRTGAVHEETNIAANTLFTSVVARFNLRLFLVISELLGY